MEYISPARSERSLEHLYFPEDIANRVQGLYVWHVPAPRNRLPEIIRQFVQTINDTVDGVIAVNEAIQEASQKTVRGTSASVHIPLYLISGQMHVPCGKQYATRRARVAVIRAKSISGAGCISAPDALPAAGNG